MFDRIMWMVALGSGNDLKGHFIKPDEFIKNKHMMKILLADQFQMYLHIGSRRCHVAVWERPDTWQGKIMRRGGGRYGMHKASLKQLVEREEMEKKAANDSTGQQRGPTNADNNKVRVCLEVRQVLHNVVEQPGHPDPGKQIRGGIIPSILTLTGQHCRLCNIDKDGIFIKNE